MARCSTSGISQDQGPDRPAVQSLEACDEAERVLHAESLEALADVLGYSYTEQGRACPEEDEPIAGKTASEYGRVAHLQPQRYEDFIQALMSWCHPAGARNEETIILDIGSGVGMLTIELARQLPGARVCGIDISPDMVSIAEEFLLLSKPELRSRVCFKRASVYDLSLTLRSLQIRSADVVLSRHMLHRLKRPALGLQQMLEAVRPGGAVYVTAFCGDLDAQSTRDELVLNVKRRLRSSSGEVFWEFARCYLSAVLRAPTRLAYEELFRHALGQYPCSDREIAYRSYEGELKVVV